MFATLKSNYFINFSVSFIPAENTGERAKLHMTEEDLNSARWQLLIKKGTVKRSDITTEPQHQRKRSLTTSDFNFSDEESSDESNDNSLGLSH